MDLTIKAVGDWTLDVLGAPYGGPNQGRDVHGEYFDERTNFHEDRIPLPPVVYYHGYEPDGRPSGAPQWIGRTVTREVKSDGVWYRVVLEKGNTYAGRVWDAAMKGIARASSGTLAHLRRVAPDGHIQHWLIAELSIFDTVGNQRAPANAYAVALPAMKAVYNAAGLDPAHLIEEDSMTTVDTPVVVNGAPAADVQHLIAEAVKAALIAEREAHAAVERAQQDEQARIDAAVKAARDDLIKDFALKMRLPDGSLGAPMVAQFAEVRKFDHLDAADQAVLVGVLQSAKASNVAKKGVSAAALKALALKLGEDQTRVGAVGQSAMKAAGIGVKADEIMQQDLTGFGDEWVGVAYSQAIWDKIRVGTFVADSLPSIEVPPGHESIYLPLEGADPTFYKVAEATDIDASGWPAATVTASQAATDRKQLTLAKMGARVLWSGELEEDSLVPFAAQLRMQLSKAGAEQLEHAIIDGDTATGATTNINHIGGTPAATDLYLLFNGPRKLALVTNTANSRDGGVLDSGDYLETVRLMGAAGINALDTSKISFIIDPNTHYKSLQLPDVRTRDVFINPTLENGKLTGIFGYKVQVSAFGHYKSTTRLANSAGKVDQTTVANNTKGAILAVRWDQWLLGYRRRMTTEVTRIPRADTTEIVCLMRLGLVNRDTEAAAISYNLTV